MYKTLLILLFFTSNILAQDRFSKLYNSADNVQDLSSQILVLSDGYLFSTISRGGVLPDTFNYAKQFLYIVKTDFNGDTVWTKQYYRRAFGIGATKIIQMSDTTFLLAGRIIDYVAFKDSNFKRDVFLIKINSQGDTLWTKTISLGHGDELVSNIIKTLDGGYVIYGQVCNQSITDCDNFIIKLDNNANLIFTHKYSFNSTSFEQPGGLVEMNDSSLYLFGNTQNTPTEEAYLIKVNNFGKLLWQKRYGLDGFRRIGISINKINNELLLNIAKATDLPDSGDPIIMKIDTSGTIIRQKKYGEIKSDVFYSLVIQNDNSIIAVGASRSFNSIEYVKGWIVKINSIGDTVWQKIYSFENIPKIEDRNTLLYDVKLSSNGIIAIGYAYQRDSNPPNQDIWLLKIDSMGCLYENCITPTGVDEVENKQELLIYPNPANNNFKIEYSTIIKSYKLIDYTGRVINQGEYSDNGVNIELLPPGIYMVQVVLENNKIAFAKLLKE